MSQGAGDQYKGYYIKTHAHAVNPHSAKESQLFEASATISLDAAAQFDALPTSHLGEDQVFDTEFEAHRHAERAAKRYIDQMGR